MPHIDPPHADGREPETAPPVGVFSSGAGTAGRAIRRRVLVVTNDFPPRLGGIQSFVHNVVRGLPADEVVVYTSSYPGAARFDAEQAFEVIRDPRTMLLPTPAVAQRVLRARQEHDATAVWFGAAAPLGLLAPTLRRAGAQRLVATTHGHELGWAQLPGARSLLRRIGRQVDVVTYLGEYSRRRLAAALGPEVALARLAPGVDLDRFSSGDTSLDNTPLDNTSLDNTSPDGFPREDNVAALAQQVRRRYDLGSAPVVVCLSRLVRRKGQDTLISAWPAIRARVPHARLLIVGRGPYEADLRAQAVRAGVAGDVVFTGGVPDDELAAHIVAGDVFAMPCRTRRHGLDVEGLGMVYLEASACARAVVAGDSGGAPDAVLDGETGFVVDGYDVAAVAERIVRLLHDPQLRLRMGRAGRAWVERDWQWPQVCATLDQLLQS